MNWLDTLAFYQQQIWIGASLGAACAALGVFVLLQRQTLFAATVSQAGSMAYAVVIFVHELLFSHDPAHPSGHSPPWEAATLNVILMAPFFWLRRRGLPNFDAVLIAGIVFFAAFVQVITLLGSMHVHLVHAYFGNILTVGGEDLLFTLPALLIVAAVFAWIYRDLVAISFDRDHARLSGVRVDRVELVFFLILSGTAALTVRLLGSFYTLAHMVLPALFALAYVRSVRAALPLAVIASVVATLVGFMLSLVPIDSGGQTVYLPTSSVIILVLAIGSAPALLKK